MTDLLDGSDVDPDDLPPADGEKVCASPGCTNTFLARGPGAHWRKYCEEHAAPPKGKKSPARTRRDKAPPSIAINLGPKTASKDANLVAVEKRAGAIAHTVAALLLLVGQPEDSADVARGSDAWAQSVRELAKYEPWIAKALAGGEMGDRAIAWVGFALSTGGIALPILLRHGALPDQLAGLVAQVLQTGADLGSGGEQPAAAA